MRITFYGASKIVTGSCYLLEGEFGRVLIDCGMFQGQKDYPKNETFGFDPKTIDYMLLTHAHIDHSGLIPKLYKEGFRGKIYCTQPTQELSEILLLDSAKIQTENERRFKEGDVKKLYLYSTDDALSVVSQFNSISIDEKVNLEKLSFKFIRAGHILGAASILIYAEGKTIIFSGDLGRRDQSLIRSFDLIDEPIDYVVMESLYGGVKHDTREHSISVLFDVINDTAERNANVIIPTFAIHRAQELSYYFNKAILDKGISEDVQIFLDSPLALKATRIYTNFLSSGDGWSEQGKDIVRVITGGANTRFVDNSYMSLRLYKKRKAILMAGSGMCDGGRILNHLYKMVDKPENSIVFVGFQAEGTLGRDIVSGKKTIQINHKDLKVKAQVHDLKGFSAHADNDDLHTWLDNKKSDRLKKVFLTHADPDRSVAFKDQINNGSFEVEIPEISNSYEL